MPAKSKDITSILTAVWDAWKAALGQFLRYLVCEAIVQLPYLSQLMPESWQHGWRSCVIRYEHSARWNE